MEKLKVAHVTLSMGIGGLEHCILNLLGGLDPHGFDTSVVCLDYPGALYPILRRKGIPAVCERRQPGLDLGLIRRLVSFFKAGGFHIVHTHNQASHFYAGIAAFLARVPVRVTTEHSRHHIAREKRRIWEKKLLYGITHQWVVVNEALREASLQEDGLSPARVSVIPNGIALPDHLPKPCPDIGAKAALGLRDDAPVILMVARLHPVKNHGMLFEAVARGRGALGAAQIVLAGDGEERTGLKALAKELGIRERVHFLGGRDDVDHLLSLADVVVLCSHSEGLPLSLLEAAAAGVPILITRAANAAGFVVNGVTGIVAEQRADDLARRLREMLETPEELTPMVEKSFKQVSKRFSSRTMVKQYGELYQSLARKKGVMG